MRSAVTISASLHGAALAWALLSLSGPPPLVTTHDSGVQIEFASELEMRSGQGEKDAEAEPQPTPMPTKRPEIVPEARHAGEANEDAPSRDGIVTDRPLDTEKVAPAPKAEQVVAAPRVEPDPVISPDREETPVPTTELASLSEPDVAVTEETVSREAPGELENEAEEEAKEVVIPVPTPAPANRPKPNRAQTTERKVVEQPKQERTATSTETRRDITDQIGRLLNTQDNTASGAMRQTRVAAIGDSEAPSSAALTRGEYDALKGRIYSCWRIPTFVDVENLQITVLMRMAREGYMADLTDIQVTGVASNEHARAIAGSLQRNLDRNNCNFSDILPGDKYETWKEVKVNFDPRDF